MGLAFAEGESARISRSRDYTPSPQPNAAVEHGGAAAYLAFLESEAIPFIERTYRADPERRTLVGQSYGGLFGACTLLTRPGLFSGYILTSPSLWFDAHMIFEVEEAFAASHDVLPARVYLATGSTETPEVAGIRNDLARDQTRFAATLRSRTYEGLEVHGGPDPYYGGARWYGN